MNLYNDGGPAFPLKRDPELRPIGGATLQTAAPITPQFDNRDQLGMSLRDYFAAKALTGYCYRTTFEKVGDTWPNYQDIARWAYEQADAMLKAREQS